MRVNVATKRKYNPTRYTDADVKRSLTVKSIDWSNSSDRKWLVNHMHWAMNNEYEVRLVPMESN